MRNGLLPCDDKDLQIAELHSSFYCRYIGQGKLTWNMSGTGTLFGLLFM